MKAQQGEGKPCCDKEDPALRNKTSFGIKKIQIHFLKQNISALVQKPHYRGTDF